MAKDPERPSFEDGKENKKEVVDPIWMNQNPKIAF